jgi:antitoxin component YwqK of YwqJK toxin-antitoxin module
MKRLLTISLFVFACTVAFAQYNQVQFGPNGNKIEEGQYNADPGLTPTDSKEIIAQKMSAIHKIGTWKYWFDNGQLTAEEHYDMSGNPTGIWKSYYADGTLESEVNKTTGAVVYYHANGTKAEEGTMNINNERTGVWKGWHDNGKLNYTGAWTSTGQKNGVWQYYDTNENIVGTEHWTNGVMN